MRSVDLENALIDKMEDYFGASAREYIVKESTDIPFLQLTLEMTLYNYIVIRVAIERSTMFFSINQSGYQLPIMHCPLSVASLSNIIQQLDQEIRLRIPDKYLDAKGF